MLKPDFIFLDMGSTLTNEESLEDYRIRETLHYLPNVTFEEFRQKMIYFAKRNQNSYKDACDYYHVEPLPWRAELLLETLQPNALETLKALHRFYPLGLIANQPLGTADRLGHYGIKDFFSVIVSSAEEGVRKPDPAIYDLALLKANVPADRSVMVGDRLDNDIVPSLSLGMHAIWIRKGYGGMGNVSLLSQKPDYIIDDISELLGIFIDPQTQK